MLVHFETYVAPTAQYQYIYIDLKRTFKIYLHNVQTIYIRGYLSFEQKENFKNSPSVSNTYIQRRSVILPQSSNTDDMIILILL